MGLASLASTLYSIQSRKNVPLRTAFSMMVREDLATRFSVFNLVKTVTKSEFLATVAHAKYGKKTPLQKEEEKEKEKQKQIELKKQQRLQKFERFTANSIGYLNRKVILLETITQKNTELITSIYNDLGYFKGQRKVNVTQINPKSIRAPLRVKSVKGKIDKINEEIERLKLVKLKKDIKPTEKKPKEKKEPKKEQNILLDLLGSIATNPLLLTAIARGGLSRAISLGGIGAAIGSAISLPKNLGVISDRLQGKEVYQDPLQEKISQAITPITGGLGVGATIGIGTELKRLYGRKKSVRAERKLKQSDKNDRVLQKLIDRGMTEKEAKAVQKARMGTAMKIERSFMKWGKLSKLFYGFSRALPALTAAEVVYEIGKISNYVSQRATNKISEAEFKKNVSKSLGEITTTIGPTTLGGIIGAAAGTALFPGAGTVSLGAIGATLGGAVSLFMPDESEEKVGEWLYGLLFEDKTAGPPPSAKSVPEPSQEKGTSSPAPVKSQPNVEVPAGVTSSSTIPGFQRISFTKEGKELEIREGGDLNWRNNNPGNIRYGDYAKSMGAIGENKGFAIFPTMEMGRKAADKLLQGSSYKDLTIAQAIARWAPRADNNNPELYAATISKMTGLNPNRKYVDLNSTEKGKFLDAMYRIEGGKSGRVIKSPSVDVRTVQIPEVVLKPIEPAMVGALAEPPPSLSLIQEEDDTNILATNLIEAQIKSEAALMAAAQIQNQVNVVSSETVKLRDSVEQNETFPSSTNPDLDEYIQDAIRSTSHTAMDI